MQTTPGISLQILRGNNAFIISSHITQKQLSFGYYSSVFGRLIAFIILMFPIGNYNAFVRLHKEVNKSSILIIVLEGENNYETCAWHCGKRKLKF